MTTVPLYLSWRTNKRLRKKNPPAGIGINFIHEPHPDRVNFLKQKLKNFSDLSC